MTCLDVVMIVAELCRKRHNKVTKKMLKTPLEYAVCFFCLPKICGAVKTL